MLASLTIRSFHPNFDTIDAYQCSFFAIVSDKAIVYTVFHNLWNRFLGVERYFYEDIQSFFDHWNAYYKQDLRSFKEHYIIYDTPQATFVPKIVWSKEFVELFTEFSQLSHKDYVSLSDYLPSEEVYNVYAISRKIHLSLMGNLGATFHFWHLQTFLFKAIKLNTYCIKRERFIQLAFLHDGFWMVCSVKGKVLFLKRFQTINPEEVAYILFQTCKIYDILIAQTYIVLSGVFDAPSSAVLERLNGLLERISLDNLPRAFDYEQSILNYPAHYFSLLFYLSVCVLSGEVSAD